MADFQQAARWYWRELFHNLDTYTHYDDQNAPMTSRKRGFSADFRLEALMRVKEAPIGTLCISDRLNCKKDCKRSVSVANCVGRAAYDPLTISNMRYES